MKGDGRITNFLIVCVRNYLFEIVIANAIRKILEVFVNQSMLLMCVWWKRKLWLLILFQDTSFKKQRKKWIIKFWVIWKYTWDVFN